MDASTSVMELIVHASGVGGGMSGTRISEAIRAIRSEAWEEGFEAGNGLEFNINTPNPYLED